jgi:prevent-host-death family protein
MTEVTIRELRTRGGDVVDLVARGEPVTITRAGQPVAELRPVPNPPLKAEVLLARWRRLPYVNYETMREDLYDHGTMITEPGSGAAVVLGPPSASPLCPPATPVLKPVTGSDHQVPRPGDPNHSAGPALA